MNKLTIIFILAPVFNAGAQNRQTFKVHFAPNKIYHASMVKSSRAEIDFSGNQEKIAKIKAKLALPMIVLTSNEIVTSKATGRLTSDGNFPVKIIFEKSLKTQQLNDNQKAEDATLSGLIAEGWYTNANKLTVDTMIGTGLNPKIRKLVRASVENEQDKIEFPDKPMQSGEAFEENLPVEVPMPGFKPLKVVVSTNYKLKEISNGKALFDIIQIVTIDTTVEQPNVSVSGRGTGTTAYDIANAIILKYDIDLDMALTMKADDLLVSLKMNSRTQRGTSVE
jgi:hypothetical protein